MTRPHITVPLDEARRRINDANHNVYRAGYQDTAFELVKAINRLRVALKLLEKVQRDYPIANPNAIDTTLSPTDPRLAPPGDES